MARTRVAVGLSGGVDSAVAAAVLLDQGHDVIGVSMGIYAGEETDPPARQGCYGPGEKQDLADCERIAAHLGIPFHVVDLVEEYSRLVLERCWKDYRAGYTPNPCLHCNRQVKFGLIPERLRQMGIGFDFFATGHYAIIDQDPRSGRRRLRMGKDRAKDQSYFLCFLTQSDLATTWLPLGEWMKDDVRRYARENALPVAEKPESQDFIAGGYAEAIAEAPRPGPILDVDGKILGVHRGVHLYTVGQRRGLGIAAPEPLFVIEIDPARDALIVGPARQLSRGDLTAGAMNWISGEPPDAPERVTARIRYRSPGAAAQVTPLGPTRIQVRFDSPQRAVAPGQGVVLYKDDVLIGGGIIERTDEAISPTSA